jgi:hypothetical protein
MVDCFLGRIGASDLGAASSFSPACLLFNNGHGLPAASHRKKRHFPGAQDFQILFHGPNRVDPCRSVSYTDFAEYCPELVHCHT